MVMILVSNHNPSLYGFDVQMAIMTCPSMTPGIEWVYFESEVKPKNPNKL